MSAVEFKQFLQMGGYAFYVWSAYGIVLLSLVAIGVRAFVKHRRLLRDLSEPS